MPRWRHSSVSYLGVFELVIDEIELGGAGEIADREHAAQRLLEARDIADRRIGAQELLVALALHLDQVRHLHDFVDVAEHLADALLGARDRSRGGWAGSPYTGPSSIVSRRRNASQHPCSLCAGSRPHAKKCGPGQSGPHCCTLRPALVSHSSRPVAQGGSCPGGGAGGRTRVRMTSGRPAMSDEGYIAARSGREGGLIAPSRTERQVSRCRRQEPVSAQLFGTRLLPAAGAE